VRPAQFSVGAGRVARLVSAELVGGGALWWTGWTRWTRIEGLLKGKLHHALAPWTESAVLSGEFRAWKTGGTTLVIAFRVAECGGRWMFAKFRAGTFTTNFFPYRGWSYIAAQVRGSTASVKSVVVSAY